MRGGKKQLSKANDVTLSGAFLKVLPEGREVRVMQSGTAMSLVVLLVILTAVIQRL